MSKAYDAIVEGEEALLCRTYNRYPIAVHKAKGTRLIDVDGREYIDLLSGIAVTALGHCNEEITETIAIQAQKLVHVSNLFYQEEQLILAKQLLATNHCTKAFFCNSGAEANEAAIKLARRYMQRVKEREAYEIITLTGCFHGRTLATVSATGQAKLLDGFFPNVEGFLQVEWGNLGALSAAISNRTAAIMLEVIQGEGGVRPVTQEYLDGIVSLCKQHDILLICDEVQAGLCRTGKWWGFQNFTIKPDIVTSAKALANGLPMGAMLTTDTVAQGFVAGSHATTFGGGALLSMVASKTLEIMERDKLADHAAKLGEWAIKRFEAVAAACPGKIASVRGMGLLLGIELNFPGQQVWAALLDNGFVLNLTQERVLRLLPALIITEEDLEAFAKALEEILNTVGTPEGK